MEPNLPEPPDDGFVLIDFGPIIERNNQHSMMKAAEELGIANERELQQLLADRRYARGP